jgi:hypothetical protein
VRPKRLRLLGDLPQQVTSLDSQLDKVQRQLEDKDTAYHQLKLDNKILEENNGEKDGGLAKVLT